MNAPQRGMLAPGLVLNHTYEIVELLGEGGTGEVYLARNRATGREVAIKLLKREFAADPTLVELMQREAEALHEIAHSAVVRYYELLRTDLEGGFTFLVMEFIRGESLADRIESGPLPPQEILQIARRVIDGLEVAHAQKVLHRDLTPANVILRDGDPAKATLIDFGIAKDLAQTKHSVIGGGFAGTYQYASPEQIDGRPLDGRSDFYSLGATLLAACRGAGAQQGRTLEQIIGAKARPPETEDLPGALRPLIEGLMQPDPANRPATAADVRVLIDGMGEVDDLDSLIGGLGAEEKTQIRRTPPGGRSAAPAAGTEAGAGDAGGSARRLLVWGGGAAVLASLAVAAWLFVPGLLQEPLPPASPYRFDLEVGPELASLSGNAPSEEEAAALRLGISETLDGRTLDGGLVAAAGLPGPDWPTAMSELASAAGPLDRWSLSVADTSAVLEGIAANQALHDSVAERAQAVASGRGLSLDLRIALAAQPLAHSAMLAAIAPFSACGPIAFAGPDPLPVGDPIRATGPVATREDAEAIRSALSALDARRSVALDLTVTSELVCQVERLLPRGNAREVGFRFGYGQRQGAVEEASYVDGDNPVVDVLVDRSYADAFLYVFYVDGNTGRVIHLLPYRDRPENRVGEAGTEEGDHYRVRVLFPAAEVGPGKRGFMVGPPYGTNILVAVASPRAFLESMLPGTDSAELFLGDLIEALTQAEMTDYVVSRELFTTRGQ